MRSDCAVKPSNASSAVAASYGKSYSLMEASDFGQGANRRSGGREHGAGTARESGTCRASGGTRRAIAGKRASTRRAESAGGMAGGQACHRIFARFRSRSSCPKSGKLDGEKPNFEACQFRHRSPSIPSVGPFAGLARPLRPGMSQVRESTKRYPSSSSRLLEPWTRRTTECAGRRNGRAGSGFKRRGG